MSCFLIIGPRDLGALAEVILVQGLGLSIFIELTVS